MSDDLRTLSVRLTPEDYEQLTAQARAEGRTIAGYTRSKLFDNGESHRTPIEEVRDELAEIREELKHLEAIKQALQAFTAADRTQKRAAAG